eukprot:3745064-Pleurochrysis_carterae.AAC.3
MFSTQVENYVLLAGTLFVRSTMDANRAVHMISAAHIMCGECNWGYTNLFSIEKGGFESQYGTASPLESAQRVTIIDGGVALQSSLRSCYPKCNIMRCRRHLVQDLRNSGSSGKAAIATLLKIQSLPRCSIEQACMISLPAQC